MLRPLALLAGAALFGVAACATAAHNDALPEKAQSRLDQFTRTTDTENCVPLIQIRNTDALSDKLILFRMNGGKYYLNEIEGGCNGLTDFNTYFTYATPQPHICKGEIVSVFKQNVDVQVGACSLGSFVKLEKKSAAQ